MTLYQKINKACEHGHYPIVENDDGELLIVSPHKDRSGDWKESLYGDDDNYHLVSIGNCNGASQSSWNEREARGFKLHGFYTPPFKYYKEGDLVDVLENAREIPDFEDWYEEHKNMVGQKGLEIREVTGAGDYKVSTKDKSDWCYLPHHCLAPHFPDSEPTEAVVKLENGKTYKVKVLEEVK